MSGALDAAASAVCRAGRHLAACGLTPGTSGNISVRVGDTFLMTPTNRALGALEPPHVSRLDARGEHLGGDPPTKERALHLAVYERRPDAGAIVHVHSTYAVALACLVHADGDDVLAGYTPYAIMRIGRLALVEYARPGSAKLAGSVAAKAAGAHALLLANHGPIFAAATLDAAVAGIEEIEEAARIQLVLHGRDTRRLTAAQVEELRS
ncbi:MAG: aldolase [Candidatus Elarobacter sp.]